MENEFIIKQVCILFHLSEKNQYYGFRIENKRWDILKACNFINLNIDEWICKIQNDPLFKQYEPYAMNAIHSTSL